MTDTQAINDKAVVEAVMILVQSLADQAAARAEIACAGRELRQGRHLPSVRSGITMLPKHASLTLGGIRT